MFSPSPTNQIFKKEMATHDIISSPSLTLYQKFAFDTFWYIPVQN